MNKGVLEKNSGTICRSYILSLLLPGLGHVACGWWHRGLVYLALLAIQGGMLYLAVMRHRLMSSVTGSSEYWFPTLMLLLIFLVIWVIALLDLRRLIQASGKKDYAQSYWQKVEQCFVRDYKGLIGLAAILIVCYVAIFAPFLARENGLKMDLLNTLRLYSDGHLLGTDEFGRDILDRLIWGSRVALGIGVTATFINMFFGGSLGLLGGYFGGAVDMIIMRFLEIINSIPYLVLALLMISLWGSSIPMLIMILGIFGLAPARIIRSEVILVRNEDYVLSARAIGASDFRIILHHVLPNAFASLLVVGTMAIGSNIIMVAGLSFLGMGVRPPTPSWGGMLQSAQRFIRSEGWMSIYPGVCIFVIVFAFNILGDSLRDVLDPFFKE